MTMLEWMALAGVILFALGLLIGRVSAENERSQEKLEELEQLSNQYRPIIKEINADIDRINLARFQ